MSTFRQRLAIVAALSNITTLLVCLHYRVWIGVWWAWALALFFAWVTTWR